MPSPPSPHSLSIAPLMALLAATRTALEMVDSTADPSLLLDQFSNLQRIFDGQVQSMTWEAWLPEQHALLQSLRVEMHKQLRLLTTDLMFVKAARQAETLEKRLKQMGDRLTALAGYCEAALQLTDERRMGVDPAS